MALAITFAFPSHMPKKKIVTNSAGPFHISARCINKEWFSLPMDLVWEIFSKQLYFTQRAFHLDIHSFLLMSNHYHALVSAPNLNLSSAWMYFQREVSRELNRHGNRINRTFAGRFHRSHIGSYHYFMNCYKYVYQNPLRAGIVQRVEDYKYSTLSGLLGKQHLFIPTAPDLLMFEGNLSHHLEWLNQRPKEEDEESIRRALKKGVFALRRDPHSRRPNHLETKLL